jgi:hypothetical protein
MQAVQVGRRSRQLAKTELVEAAAAALLAVALILFRVAMVALTLLYGQIFQALLMALVLAVGDQMVLVVAHKTVMQVAPVGVVLAH